jgi:hypothetical protein
MKVIVRTICLVMIREDATCEDATGYPGAQPAKRDLDRVEYGKP